MTSATLTIADRKALRVDRIKETYKSLIGVSGDFFKCLLLVNAVALAMAVYYLADPRTAVDAVLARQLVSAVHLFIMGIVFCGLALFFSCFAQVHTLNQDMTGEKGATPQVLLSVPAGLCLLSILVFSAGAWFSAHALSLPRDKGGIISTAGLPRAQLASAIRSPVADLDDAVLRCSTDARRLYSGTVMGKQAQESYTIDDVEEIRRYERRCMNLAGYTMDRSLRSCPAQFLPEEDPACYRPRREWRYRGGYGT